MRVLFVSRSSYGYEGEKDRLSHGDLLTAAEDAGFDVLVTADKNIRYQQNLEGRRIALVVLGSPQWPAVKLHVEKIAEL